MPTSQLKSKSVWIISGLLVLILLAGGAWFFIQSKAKAEAEAKARARQENLKQAETTARNFLEAMAAKDLEKASSYFKISEVERKKVVEENGNQPDFWTLTLKVISVGPAAYAPDNSQRIMVPATMTANNQKTTNQFPLEYDADRQCWLIVPDK